MTEDLFVTAPAVGDVVSPQVGAYELGAVVAGARLTLEVIEATTLGFTNVPAFAVRVLTV